MQRRTFLAILATTIVNPVVLAMEPELIPLDWDISNGILSLTNFDLADYGNILPRFRGKFTETGFDTVVKDIPFIDIQFKEVQARSEDGTTVIYKYYADVKLLLPRLLKVVAIYANEDQII